MTIWNKITSGLKAWQIIAGFIMITYSVFATIPSSWYLMTQGDHDKDNRYVRETTAAKNIHYFEWKLCDKTTGQPNARVLSTLRESKLTEAYNEYKDAAGTDYPLRAKNPAAKCHTLKEDDL